MVEEDQAGERRSDSGPVQVRRTCDWSATKPSTAAINALATVENADPVELATEIGIVLHDHVNPEALDALVRDGISEQTTVIFAVDDYQIRFEDDELVVHSRDR